MLDEKTFKESLIYLSRDRDMIWETKKMIVEMKDDARFKNTSITFAKDEYAPSKLEYLRKVGLPYIVKRDSITVTWYLETIKTPELDTREFSDLLIDKPFYIYIIFGILIIVPIVIIGILKIMGNI